MSQSLFGYGVTTKALAQTEPGWNIFDDGCQQNHHDDFGNQLLASSAFDAHESTLEIPSPGLPPQHPLIQAAKHLLSEYDYFFPRMPPSVWISGTNGKTTLTQMLHYLIDNPNVLMGGNIGTPLAHLNTQAKQWILETSSFTLHYTQHAYPILYLLLPISQDHLSWHQGFRAYEASKLKPLSLMPTNSTVILPEAYQAVPTKAQKISYQNSTDLAKKMGFNVHDIAFSEPFLLDALLALSAHKILYGATHHAKLNHFQIGIHRLQTLHDQQGRTWINDTKGTNPHATIAAIKRYAKTPLHLILGGDDKGVNLDTLFEALKPLDVTIYAIGSNMKTVLTHAKAIHKVAYACYELKKAIGMIDRHLDHHSVALLSPAAASTDQFDSYIQRGEIFIETVSKLT